MLLVAASLLVLQPLALAGGRCGAASVVHAPATASACCDEELPEPGPATAPCCCDASAEPADVAEGRSGCACRVEPGRPLAPTPATAAPSVVTVAELVARLASAEHVSAHTLAAPTGNAPAPDEGGDAPPGLDRLDRCAPPGRAGDAPTGRRLARHAAFRL